MNNIVMYDSPESAKWVDNISGWVSSKGHFYGNNEDLARYDGCTHKSCNNCGKPTTKTWLICSDCRAQKEIEKYYGLEGLSDKQWKEIWESKYSNEFEEVYYSNTIDHYFFDFDQLWEHCDDNDCSMASLRLQWCEPEFLKEVDSDLYYQDVLEEGHDAPLELVLAFEELNSKIRKFNSTNILCYYPSKYRVII